MTDNMLAEMIESIGPSLALCWYLSGGLFPPIPAAYEDAVAAIEAVADDRADPFAHQMVRSWHLEPFVMAQVEYDDAA